jgi:hypothetical protein
MEVTPVVPESAASNIDADGTAAPAAPSATTTTTLFTESGGVGGANAAGAGASTGGDNSISGTDGSAIVEQVLASEERAARKGNGAAPAPNPPPGWQPRADVNGQSLAFLEGGRDRLRMLIAAQMPYFAKRPYIADPSALDVALGNGIGLSASAVSSSNVSMFPNSRDGPGIEPHGSCAP